MEIKIFISHVFSDYNKAKSFAKEIDKHSSLKPILIVDKKELRTLFVSQVKTGIENSDYVIPILTKASLTSQWVNQEIGFAEAKEKVVFPLIDSTILHKLKGFIHKEEEHFCFIGNKANDSRAFRKTYLSLIKHILGLEALKPSNYYYQTAITLDNSAITIDFKYPLTKRSKFIFTINQSLIEQSFVIYIKIVTDQNERFWIGFSNLFQINNKFTTEHVFKIHRSSKLKYHVSENIYDKLYESGLKFNGKPNMIEAIRFWGAESQNNPIHYYYTLSET